MTLPGGEISQRELHFFWIADCSGSMNVNGKIQSLNNAIREAIPAMQDVAEQNPNAKILVRAIKFSSGAEWHISQATEIEDFKWQDLEADGVTDMGRAFDMVADQLTVEAMPARGLPPVLVLTSDGHPTDDYNSGLQNLLEKPWGKKAVKLAIAIGDDAEMSVLNKFVDNPELKVLKANNSEQLTKYIKWVSTEVVKSASSGSSDQVSEDSENATNVELPSPPDTDDVSKTDVF